MLYNAYEDIYSYGTSYLIAARVDFLLSVLLVFLCSSKAPYLVRVVAGNLMLFMGMAMIFMLIDPPSPFGIFFSVLGALFGIPLLLSEESEHLCYLRPFSLVTTEAVSQFHGVPVVVHPQTSLSPQMHFPRM